MRVVEVYEDDLDGSKAEVTLSFALDGTSYEIDLSEANAQRMREMFQPYIEAGRSLAKARPQKRSNGKASGVTPADVRSWARDSGYEVNERGRIPANVLAAYQAANGG